MTKHQDGPPGGPMPGGFSFSRRHVATLSRLLMQGDLRRAKEAGRVVVRSDSVAFLTFALERCHLNHAQLAQDLWVLYELAERRNGFFVEFGAGDGVVLSNTCLLEKRYGWRGVLAEPNPVFHAALRRNRRALISHKCVVGSAIPGEVAFNQTSDPHLSVVDAYSDSDGHATARRDGRRIRVPTQTLLALLEEAKAPARIDFLSIDTEGSELDILEGFDFDAYTVALVTVEHNHTANQDRIDALMEARGFRRRFRELSDFDAWYRNVRLFS